MGTSSSGNGPRPTTPLIPSWIPQSEPSEPPHEDQGNDEEVDDSNESSQEEGKTEGVETVSTNGDDTTSPNRYADSRHKFSSAFKSHGDRGPILTAAIRSYVRRGGGGSSKMAKRLAPSAFRVARFGIVLNTFREHGASAALRTFNLQNYASRPVIEVLSALTDIIFDKSSPYSNIKDDSITKLAYTNTINRVAQMESIDLDSLTNENIEVMLAIFIEETITTRVICDIGAKPYKNERNAEEILQMEETIFQIVSGLVRNRIMPQIMASQRGSQEELEETFRTFTGLRLTVSSIQNKNAMGKFALIVRLGSNDNERVVEGEEFLMTGILNLLNRRDATEIKFDKLFSQLKKLRLEPNERSMDLLIIACAMYTADTRIERQRFSEDSWTRAIKLFIPVAEYDFWLTQQQRLIEIFKFLTGDLWEIKFRPRTNQDAIAPRGRRRNYGMSYSTNVVSLFSGGMDSFIGAIDLLSSGVQPLLLGHAKSADVSPYQRKCEDALHQAFSQVTFQRLYSFIRVPKDVVYPSEEKSERGRSFLFLTLGGIVAACLSDQSVLIVPENGLISLNLPLTPLRVGSHSTRTTHPHYMAMMQELFRNMMIGVTVKNPYQFKTKGEMLLECADRRLVETTSTMSCSHPAPKRGDGIKHCGYCVPCLIRKAAFLRTGLTDRMEYRVNIGDRNELDTIAKIDNILAFKYMIKKAQNNPSYIDSVIRMTGPLGQDVSSYKETYTRGLREVSQLLNTVNL